MKVSYNWLKEYVSLDGVTPQDLANKLTTAGMEVEGLEPVAQGTNLIIGEVLTCEEHPDSDHLHVTTVNVGNEVLQIVCGAPNVAKGEKVIVARNGAVLPDGEIKKSKVRGVESNGMICALFELGVDKHRLTQEQLDGIEILPSDAPVGETNVFGYLGLDDYVLDIGLTPNRADCNGMWNMAKEVGAVLHREAKWPTCEGISDQACKPSSFKVHSTTDKCPHFLGKVVNKVVVKPSPKWMQDYLHAAGIKAINNVVDISNYVMLETGQPLHFYDLSKLPHREITVVDDVDMTMTALDGIEYEIKKGDLLITTGGEPTGVAGIMGGEDSKIDEATTSIFIESALFNAVSIRKTAARLGLSTEAASRFTKGLEPLSQKKALDRSIQLLQELAETTADDLEENVEYGTVNFEPKKVTETISHCNELLGTNYSKEQIDTVLASLDFLPTWNGEEVTCTIPSYRTDIEIREDLDEEIIRLLGYDSLTSTLPTMKATVGALNKKQRARRDVKDILMSVGCNEVVTYTLVKDEYIQNAIMPFGENVALSSPISEDRKYVRNSLLCSMLETVAYNQNRKADSVNLFEVSNVYEKDVMEERIGIALSGSLQKSRLQGIEIKSDFYALKGIILTLLEKLGFSGNRITVKENTLDTEHFHPYQSAELYIQRELIGIFGTIHPSFAKKMGVSKVVYAELLLDKLLENKASKVKFVPIEKYPSVSRDIALVVKKDIKADQIMEVITKTGKKLVKSVEVFDVYEGEHVEEGSKSVALNIIYQAQDHTLVDEEINAVHQSILDTLQEKVDAVLRA